MVSKFRKKPIVIEAIQLTWANWSEICDFVGVGHLEDGRPEGSYYQNTQEIALYIPTPEGIMEARENDWIIKGVKGEFYPCKPDIFEKSYEPAIVGNPNGFLQALLKSNQRYAEYQKKTNEELADMLRSDFWQHTNIFTEGADLLEEVIERLKGVAQ